MTATPTFVEVFRSIGVNAPRLITQSLAEQHAWRTEERIPLLTAPGWIPERPLGLEDVRLTYTAGRTDGIDEARRRLVPYWDGPADGEALPTYSGTVGRNAPPPVWFDGPSYRLLGVNARSESVQLDFTGSTYFEGYDTTESLGYEAAYTFASTGGQTITGPYRTWLADPFDLTLRSGIPGVNTLTVRQSRNEATFYLHRRTGVATARNTVHVVPAGEFQPSASRPGAQFLDLDLRTTIVREYTEEFLGAADIVNPVHSERPHDDERVDRALRGGSARCFYLGLGLYSLTWKPEILIVCVFDSKQFDRTFAGMVSSMVEGRFEGPGGRLLNEGDRLHGVKHILPGLKGPYQGLPFDERTVRHYADSSSTLPAARACLELAWQHRGALGIRA